MCGIAGILRVHEPGAEVPPHHEVIPEAWLDTLDESIKHRGPDGAGRFRDRVRREDGSVVDVALVHRRLSIIDHADGGQPMVHVRYPDGSGELLRPMHFVEDSIGGRPEGIGIIDLTGETHEVPERVRTATDVVAVVFNGCIYNHRELRAELEGLGHKFETDHSDTEVLVHGWRAWCGDLPLHLRGMYALGIWQRATGVLFRTRDSFGEKPLPHAPLVPCSWVSEGFCSSASGLAKLPESVLFGGSGARSIRTRSLVRWLRYGYGGRVIAAIWDTPLEQETPVGKELWCFGYLKPTDEPWHARLVRKGPRPRGAYSYGMAPPGSENIKQAEAVWEQITPLNAEAVESLLSQAVCGRLEADVPMGCFLSGGLDSSLIAFFAKRATPDLKTFCVRMPDPRYDESEAASLVAEAIGTDHHTLDCSPTPADDLVRLIHILGGPFGDSSLLPTYWLSRAVREHVSVALSGDGGDELFCGYQRYKGAKLLEEKRNVIAALSDRAFSERDPRSKSAKLARLVRAARLNNPYEMMALFDEQTLSLLVGEKYGRRTRPKDKPAKCNIGAVRAADLSDYLRFDLLRKVDTASMLVGLEVRVPMLDHDLVSAAIHTKIKVLMPGGERKGLLKQVARKYLPPEIVDRPKQGFAIPIGAWFRNDFGGMRQLLYDHLESAEPFPGLREARVEINMDFVRRMLREHDAAGEKSLNPWHGRDHSQRLYMLLVLSIWAKWLAGLRGGGVSEDLG
jgi:asparagine synthase (glutamine-hydrolysing)